MDINRPQHESADPDRDDLAEILAPVFGVEPVSISYRAKLAEQLDAEYAALFGDQTNGHVSGDQIPIVGCNGQAESNHSEIESTSPRLIPSSGNESASEEKPEPETADPKSPAILRFRPWLKWGVAAACLLVAISWWASSSPYSWASMIAALEQSQWIQILVELQPGQTAEGWLSDEHQVVALKSQGQLRLDDYARGTRLSLAFGNKAVAQDKAPPAPQGWVENQLVRLLLNASGQKSLGEAEPASGLRVLSESSRYRDDGAVELQVVLSVGNSAKEITLLFVLDPETRLPTQAKILAAEKEDKAREEAEVAFNYPNNGPHDIYPLGASRELPIVSSTDLTRLAKESTKIAAEPKANPEHVALRPTPAEQLPPPKKPADVAPPPPPQPKKELPPARSVEEMTGRIDELLHQHWARKAIEPANPAGDDEFLRRAYLDFTGRIPTVSEVRTFLADTRSDRRDKLLDELLDRYDHATHLAAVWRTFLIPETADLTALGGVQDFEAWLTERFRNNQPYDKLVTDLLLAEGRAQTSGPLLFYAALKLQPEEIARQTSRAFLGLQLECAQCHDHFFDDQWKQRDFWGFAAFFARISQPEGKLERVSPVMRVRDSSHGEVMLPGTNEVVPPRFPHEEQAPADIQEASRRQLLAAWLTSPDNAHFARATVNRVWSQLFGLGIVNPVDDMRVANQPICPELLSELAEYFVRTGYDLRRLYATLARTSAYQLSSSSAKSDSARAANFAQMNVKCFTAEQLYDCISVATRVDAVTGPVGISRFNNYSRQTFLEQFRAPPGNTTEYQAGIAQALTLINGSLLHSATQLQTSGLLRSLRAPFFTDEQRVETLFLATVSRHPSEREKSVVLAELKAAKNPEERASALGDTLWALLNSAEFTLIH
jgi:hypothetical protein